MATSSSVPILLTLALLSPACSRSERSAPVACPSPVPAYPQEAFGANIGQVPFPLKLHDEKGPLSLARFYEPCASRSRLLVLRTMASWCGTCQWHAAHTGELLRSAVASRLVVVDALAYDEYNQPAQPPALPVFARYYDAAPQLYAADQADFEVHHVGFSVDGSTYLPLILLIDTRTMKVQARLSNPDRDTLLAEVRRALFRLDGVAEARLPPPARPALYDGRFTRDRWDMIRHMTLPSPLLPPQDPTNRVADNPDAAALGELLVNDTGLTAAGEIACATCHRKDRFFMDGLPTALGLTPAGAPAQGDRNTPWLGGVAFSRFLFWDGRADSTWSQALGPLESEREISSNRLRVVRAALRRYGDLYTKVFGPPPDLRDMRRFPADGKPGMPSWERMAPGDRHSVNRAFANLGKAIAAFERSLLPAPVALDRYAAGNLNALSSEEKDGLLRFFEVGCAQCHHGPLLTDDSFHSNYLATGRQDGRPDPGCQDGFTKLSKSEFRGDGPYSDAPKDVAAAWLARLPRPDLVLGLFKTRSLRGVADTAPYMHGGSTADLQAVVDLYADGGLPDGDPRTRGTRDFALVRFDKKDARNKLLVKFLQTFKGTLTGLQRHAAVIPTSPVIPSAAIAKDRPIGL